MKEQIVIMSGGNPYLAASITGCVAVLLWLATRIAEYFLERSRNSKEKEKFLRALYAEIDFNTRDMEEFVENPIPINAVIDKVRSQSDFIPHVTDARHTEIYRSNIERISHAGDFYIADVIYFYGLLERIKGQIDGVYLPSYTKISANGRANVINRIYDDSFTCAGTGRAILRTMEESYPNFKFRRKMRTATENVSIAELSKRCVQFELDLDRVRSAHRRSS